MFQSNNGERLAVPAIKDSKHRKTGHCDAQNVSQIGGLKTSEMTTLRVVQQVKGEIMSCLHKLDGNLRTSVLDANAVSVVAYSSVKGRMNK